MNTTTPAPVRLQSRPVAVATAFSAVVGAGLIALPAAVFHESGSAAVAVWLVAMTLCIPMIVLFRDTVVAAATVSDPLRDTVTRGLGRRSGELVPLGFLLVVVVGLPTNAMVGGQNLAAALGLPVPGHMVAVVLLATAIGANLVGARLGASLQALGSVVLVGALLLVAGWLLVHAEHPPAQIPHADALPVVAPGVLLAFWAFVGFENLTFVARDLREPRRDFLPVALTALALVTGLAVLLTFALATHTTPASSDPVTGLVDAAAGGTTSRTVLGVAGLLAILLNALAWVRGVGLLIDSAARERILPSWLASPSADRPHRAVLALGAGCAVTLVVLGLRPGLVVDAMAAASAVFVTIYLVCIAAYVRLRGLRPSTAANLALVPVFVVALVQSGWRSVYALVVVGVALGYRRIRSRSGRRATGAGPQ